MNSNTNISASILAVDAEKFKDEGGYRFYASHVNAPNLKFVYKHDDLGYHLTVTNHNADYYYRDVVLDSDFFPSFLNSFINGAGDGYFWYDDFGNRWE